MAGLETLDLVIIGLGAVSLIIWFIFYLMGLKHNAMFEVLEEKEYPFKEIYGLGYAVLELFKSKQLLPKVILMASQLNSFLITEMEQSKV